VRTRRVLANVQHVIVELNTRRLVLIYVAVIRRTKNCNHSRNLFLTYELELIAIKACLMCSYNGNKIVRFQEVGNGANPEVVRALSSFVI